MSVNETANELWLTENNFDRKSFQDSVRRFLLEGRYRNLSDTTLEFYRFHLLGFERFLTASHQSLTFLSYPQQVKKMITEMQEQMMAPDTMKGRIRTCRRFFRFLYPEETWEPIQIPALKDRRFDENKLSCFTQDQIQAILEQPNQRTFNGYRDYVMMLVLLDTGIRLMELTDLKISDIDFEEMSIGISMGKGQKSRFVPIQITCAESLKTYINLRGKTVSDHLWITCRKTPL
jgi:integrase/recombinase XerD